MLYFSEKELDVLYSLEVKVKNTEINRADEAINEEEMGEIRSRSKYLQWERRVSLLLWHLKKDHKCRYRYFKVIGWKVEIFHTDILNFNVNCSFLFSKGDYEKICALKKRVNLGSERTHSKNFPKTKAQLDSDHGLRETLVCLII